MLMDSARCSGWLAGSVTVHQCGVRAHGVRGVCYHCGVRAHVLRGTRYVQGRGAAYT